MNKLEVTEEMKNRVFGNLQNMISSNTVFFSKKATMQKAHPYRKYAAIAAGLTVLLAGAFAFPKLIEDHTQKEPSDLVGVFGIQEFASAQELSVAVGFEIEDISGAPFQARERVYQSYQGEVAEIIYRGEDGEELIYRKAAGEEDVSGDYNDYIVEKEVSAGGKQILLKGDKKAYYLAVWTEEGFSYSISCANGLSEKEWIKMAEF